MEPILLPKVERGGRGKRRSRFVNLIAVAVLLGVPIPVLRRSRSRFRITIVFRPLRLDVEGNMRLGKWSAWTGRWRLDRLQRSAVFGNRISDSSGDLIARRIGETDIQDAVAIPTRHIHGSVDSLENIGLEQIQSSQHPDLCAVAIEQVAMLCHLGQFHFGHFHQRIHLELGPFEILDTKRIDGDDLHSTLIADFENLDVGQRISQFPFSKRSRRNKPTLANASNPRLCPSTVSIPCVLANLRFPSITNATCRGTGPCLSAPTSNSRRCEMAYSIGGDARNHFRSRDRCIDVAMVIRQVVYDNIIMRNSVAIVGK